MRRAEESLLNHSIDNPNDVVLLAPFTGPVVPLADVPDPVFAEGMFGDGIGIDPLDNVLVSPCDGTITHLARTHHAVTLRTEEGAEILVHIGIDTVELGGKGFTPKVEQGATVRAGEPLIEFDADLRRATRAESRLGDRGRERRCVRSHRSRRPRRAESGRAHAGVAREARRESRDGARGANVHGRSAPQPDAGARGRPACASGGAGARSGARFRREGRSALRRQKGAGGKRGRAARSRCGRGRDDRTGGIGAQAQQAVEAVAAELLRAAQGEVEETPARAKSPAPVAKPARDRASRCRPNTLAGVCAAPGIAVGKLVRWDDQEIVPPEQASGSSATESRALDKAIAQVDAELGETVRTASQRGAVGEAGIFAVHRVLLEDPTLARCRARSDQPRQERGLRVARGDPRADRAALERAGRPARRARRRSARHRKARAARARSENTAARELPEETVLAANEFTPSDLSSIDRTRVTALVMARGGATSHAAIIARQIGIPALVAIGDALHAIPEGTQVVVDASAGRVEHAPTALDVERARNERERLAGVREANRKHVAASRIDKDGRQIEVAANIATLDDAKAAVENGADAVGLLRTELLFIHRQSAPTVAEHAESYQGIVDALQGRTAIIRTLDVGADKEVDYLTLPPEENPALGLRGIRLAQVRPDLLDDQLRGLLAVKPSGTVRILLPMVTDAGELQRLRARIDELAREAGRTDPVEVGVMIEVPSAALLADQLAKYADFLSIGTNDLTQYTLAMDRCQPDLAAQSDGLHPAVLRLIKAAVQGAEKHGKWVGVCGALGGDPVAVPLLVGLGVTELSVDPVSVPGIKARVRNLDYQLCRQRAEDALALESAQAVRAASREIWPQD